MKKYLVFLSTIQVNNPELTMIQARSPWLAQPPKPSVKLLSGYIPKTDTIQIDIDVPDTISVTIITAPQS